MLLLDVRILALISALFALARWPATLLMRLARSSSFKTFAQSARGCSKSTTNVDERKSPCQHTNTGKNSTETWTHVQ